MELIWLEDFVALAECGSFVRAAEARHITQPAFSRRIRALENWIGAPLFVRTPQGTSLTEAGRCMHQSASAMANRLYRLRDEVRDVAGKTARTLQFAATHSLSFTFFPRWIRQIEQGAPIEAVQLHSESMASCEQMLKRGQVHFLLSHGHPEVPPRLDPGQFTSRTIARDTLIPLIGAGLVEGSERDGRDSLGQDSLGQDSFDQDFFDQDYLAYTEASGLGRIVAHHLQSVRELNRQPLFSSHLAAVLMSMALENKGLAWLPHILVEPELREGRLVRALDAKWEFAVDIQITRANTPLTPFAEAFWERLSG